MYSGKELLSFIEELISRFGPREGGSAAEKAAQEHLRDLLLSLTPKVRLDEFEDHLSAKFMAIRLFVAIYFIALLLSFQFPHYAFFLALVNTTFFLLDFVAFRSYLKFLFPRKRSSNLSAVLEPRQEAKQTILISAHIDSTTEFTWWYRLGETGLKLTVVAGLLLALLPLPILLRLLLPGSMLSESAAWLFLALSPLLLTYWQMKSGSPTPGAQDNLSGISIALHTFRHFAENPLQHTRLVFCSFGCEECGLIGSSNYVEMRLGELQKHHPLILNFDSVRLEEEVSVITKELMNGSKHDPELALRIEQSFTELGLPVKRATIPIGGTDAVPFNRAGFKTLSIIGISTKSYDFTYHTRHDLPEHVAPNALENCHRAVVHFIQKTDETHHES